jgi:hypothetical protein
VTIPTASGAIKSYTAPVTIATMAWSKVPPPHLARVCRVRFLTETVGQVWFTFGPRGLALYLNETLFGIDAGVIGSESRIPPACPS